MQTEKSARIYRFLKETDIFKGVPEAQLEEAAAKSRLVHMKHGSILYRKGDSANYMYFLQEGNVMESVYYRDSVDIIVKVKRPGDYFGETAVMTDTEYLNTALVVEDAVLAVMPKEAFLRLAWDNHSVCQVVIRELVERLTNSAQNMVNSMYLEAPGRLAFTILNLITGPDGAGAAEIRVTQSALAASAGMARQTAAKILGDWRREGWLSTDRGRLAVLDLDRLLSVITESEMRC